MKHLLLSLMSVLLLRLPCGRMFALRSSPELNPGRAELDVRGVLLEALNLQQEPRVSVSRMKHLREPWRSSGHSSPGNWSAPEDSSNSTCCRFSSQIFMSDLGWDRWVVHPESVVLVQCRSCSSGQHSSEQCCGATAQETVPFIYVDEWSSLVLSSVSLTRECGCEPGEESPEPLSPP